MKRFYFLMLFITSMIGVSYAQVETNYFERGENSHNPWESAVKGIDIKRMPSFDLTQLQREDAERDSTGGLFRFGKAFDVSYTLADGQWETVDGGRLWTMAFASDGALSLNFVFNDFRLPQGAELYIENEDKMVLYGPVTAEATTDNGIFLTDIISGEQATIYLYEPSECEGQSSLTIKRIVHGYRTLEGAAEDSDEPTRSSGIYSPRIACYPDYYKESNGVAKVLSSGGNYICNGALVMAEDYSFRGYFLTTFDLIDTNHDDILSTTEISAAQNSAFIFRCKYKECEGGSMESTITYNQATFRSAWYKTRFALLEIYSNISENNNLTWLGWDRLPGIPTCGACIHHQEQTDMRICLGYENGYNQPFYISSWMPESLNWYLYFSTGGVSPASHGAPLLDANKRIIAIEFGEINYGYNSGSNVGYFGPVSNSWDGGLSYTTGLSHWLDPNGTNTAIMNSSRTFIIKGPNKIVSSSTYYIRDLPSDLTVTWSISDPYYNQYQLQQNSPSYNKCKITKDASHSLSNATLTATITKNGTLVKTVNKMISTGSGFDGTYYNGQSTVQVDLPSPLYVLPGTFVTIQSNDLIGATVTKSGGNGTPTSWSFNGTSGTLQIGMPSGSGNTIVVKVVTSGGATYYLPITTTNDTGYLMSVTPTGNSIEVSISTCEGMNNDARSESGIQDWTLETYNVTTGDKVFGKKVDGSGYTIDTTGWKPGVYAVRAVVGKNVLSEKVIVK